MDRGPYMSSRKGPDVEPTAEWNGRPARVQRQRWNGIAWLDMLDGEDPKDQPTRMVLKAKLSSGKPNLRRWVAVRILEEPSRSEAPPLPTASTS